MVQLVREDERAFLPTKNAPSMIPIFDISHKKIMSHTETALYTILLDICPVNTIKTTCFSVFLEVCPNDESAAAGEFWTLYRT